MAEPSSSDSPNERPPRSSRTGIGARAAAVAASFLDYFDARFRLLGLEAREARGAVLRRVVSAAVGAFFLLLGYLALLAGSVGFAAAFFEKPWHLMALAAGGLHILAGGLLLLYARAQLQVSPFRDTRREFEKDREWLNSMRPPKP